MINIKPQDSAERNFIIRDLPDGDYFSIDAVSKSSVCDLEKSAGLYYAKHIAKTYIQETTPAMAFGTAVHTAVLEPLRFAEEYLVQPDFGDARSKAAREAKGEWLLDNEGRTILKSAEMEDINGIVKALEANPDTHPYIKAPGDVELAMFWQDEMTGIRCKAKADKVVRDRVIVDLKTAIDSSPEGFAKASGNFKYHVQAASYSYGFSRIYGYLPTKFVFIAVEKKPPYLNAVYTLSDRDIMAGWNKYVRLLQELERRLRLDDWPRVSHTVGETELELPFWAVRDDL